mgnify:CR=1 FL=1
MLAYGYERESEGITPLELEQTCLTCNTKELDALIAFLQHVRAEDAAGEGHWHFRDYDKSWDEAQSDFIIVWKD